ECLLGPVQGSAELLPCSLGFNALGEITFSIKNRGSVGVNTGQVGSVGTKTRPVSGPKIKIDIYLQDKLIQSIYHGSLGSGASKQFTVKIPSNYPTPRCGETRALKIVVDPQNQIVEASDANNVLARTADRPCPDMAIDSIKKNSNDLKTEFVAQIRLVNKGNAHARFRYLALTSNSSSFGPLPSADFDKLMEIPPGQGKTFTIGNAFGYQKMYVRVFLDRFNEVAELDESNNFKEKTLD
ncbi:MAG: hypothetical protein LC732_12380, partial [Acidobacteria bacterium]|nr:hypothetical protein [Acidobacteriota bacterium]